MLHRPPPAERGALVGRVSGGGFPARRKADGGRPTAGKGGGVWMRRAGPGRGRGSLLLQRPRPSVLLGTKPIPGFLPKAASTKDLFSLPLLLSCGLLWWLRLSRIRLQYRKHVFDSWIGKIPWRRKLQPTPVFLPRKSSGQRILAGHRVPKSQTLLTHQKQEETFC